MWRSALKMLWDLAEESSANFATSTSSHLSIKVFSFLSSRERVSREEKQIWSEFKCRAYSFFFSFTAYHYHFFTFNSCDNAYQHTAVFTSLRYPDFKETKKKIHFNKNIYLSCFRKYLPIQLDKIRGLGDNLASIEDSLIMRQAVIFINPGPNNKQPKCAKSVIAQFPPTQRGSSFNLQFEHYQLLRYEKKMKNLLCNI